MPEREGLLNGLDMTPKSPKIKEMETVAKAIHAPITYVPRDGSPLTINGDRDNDQEPKPTKIMPNLSFAEITGPWRPLREGEKVDNSDIDIIDGIPSVPARKYRLEAGTPKKLLDPKGVIFPSAK